MENSNARLILEYEHRSEEYREKKTLHFFITCLYTSYAVALISDVWSQLHWHVGDIVAVLTGMYFSDLVTGLIHIYLDTHRVVFACDKIREMGPISAKLNRISYAFQFSHHVNPVKMIKDLPVTATDGQLEILIYLATPILLITKVAHAHMDQHDNGVRLTAVGTETFVLFAMSSQIIHAFTHLPRCKVPFVWRLLQSSRLILSNQEHLRHHKQNEYYFSIVNGWSNPFLNCLYKYVLKPLFRLNPDNNKTNKSSSY